MARRLEKEITPHSLLEDPTYFKKEKEFLDKYLPVDPFSAYSCDSCRECYECKSCDNCSSCCSVPDD